MSWYDLYYILKKVLDVINGFFTIEYQSEHVERFDGYPFATSD